MDAKPQKEHAWLDRFVGEWSYEMDAAVEPGTPQQKFTGTESVRSLGGMWILCEGRGQMPDGTPSTTIMTLGYDPAKQRYVGTFIGSMMTHLWIYQGSVNAAGNTLVLDTEGPSFAGDGSLARYQDTIEWKSNDHRVLTSTCQDGTGKYQHFMTAHYRRA